MKTKEQKMREAVKRAKEYYYISNKKVRGWTLEEYLDLFLPQRLKGTIQPLDNEAL